MRFAFSMKCLLALLLLLPGACSRLSNNADSPAAPRDPRKFTPGITAAAEARAQAIRDELTSLGDHPWAGEYYCGDGLGVNVRLLLAPAGGFVFTWHGCLGLYDQNFGSVTTDDQGRLILHCEFQNNRCGFRGIATMLVPVRWDQRQYLVADDEMIDFCNAVDSGLAHMRGRPRFLLRRSPGETTPPVTAALRRVGTAHDAVQCVSSCPVVVQAFSLLVFNASRHS